MKVLQTLVKLNKSKLDKVLAKIKKVEQEKANLILRKDKIKKESEEEANKYSNSQYAYMLDQYLQNSRKLQTRIQAQIDRLDKDLEFLQQELKEQFSELKKFEIALENKKHLVQTKIKQQETKYLDELNTNKFAYNQKN